MIKPIKLASQIIDIGTQAVSKNTNKTDNTLIEASSNLAEVSSQLLQSYKGVKVKKLFDEVIKYGLYDFIYTK